MSASKLGLFAAVASLSISSAAAAMPNDAAALRHIITTQYGGNATAYAAASASDFEDMGCEGRTDLLQVMLDEGLDLSGLAFSVHHAAAFCAMKKKQTQAFTMLVTSDLISGWEDRCAGNYGCWMPLRSAIQRDDYGTVLAVLQAGPHYFWEHKDYMVLSREENLLQAARTAITDAKEESQRAFVDAGFGHILEASRNKDNRRYIEKRIDEAKGGGGGIGGLLGSVAGVAAGAALGGAVGTGMALGGAAWASDEAMAGDTSQPTVRPPLPLESSRPLLGLSYIQTRDPQRGIEVQAISPGGLADNAGLVKGDVIVGIGGVPTSSRGALYVAGHGVNGEESFEVEYLRAGERQSTVFGLPPQELADSSPAVPAAAPVAAMGQAQALAELERLADLRDRGMLSDEEFEVMKARILGLD